MDRHQFVEKLIAQRNELATIRDNLKKTSSIAFDRSLTRFRKLFVPEKDMPWPLTCGFSFKLTSHADTLKENAKVTDEDIQSLCGEIAFLKKEIDELDSEVTKYRDEDFVKTVIDLLSSDERAAIRKE